MSCVFKKIGQGQYISKGKDYQMKLIMNQDSSFLFVEDLFEVHKVGKGHWRLKGKDTLILKCQAVDSPAFGITQDYLSGQEIKFSIINNKQLKLLNAVFRKVN